MRDVDKIEVMNYEGNVTKTESYYRYLTAMQLAKIATYGRRMLEKQDMMLDKQDTTIETIKEESEKTRDVMKVESEKEECDQRRSWEDFIKT